LFSIYYEQPFRNLLVEWALTDKSPIGAQATPERQTAAEIREQIDKRAEGETIVPGGECVHPAVRPPVQTEGVMVRISKALVAGISALAMAGAVVVPTTPASAGDWHGDGFHDGGWHGGGWGGRGMWHGGYWRGGYWNNGWWGPAVAAGVIGGAAIAGYPY